MKWTHSVFILIIILAFFLRAQETLSGNFLFLLDQGRDLLAVKKIVFDHRQTLIGPYTSLSGVFQGPLWYYLLAIPLFLDQGNPRGTVILMLVISLLVVFLAFLGMRRLFGLIAGLLTAYLFAISPEAVAAATFAWNPHPMWLVLIIYVFALFETVSANKKYHLLLWPVITLAFHFQTALGVFLLLTTLIYFIVFQRRLLKNKHFAFGLLLSLLFLLPQIIFDFRHDFLMLRSIIKSLTINNQSLFAGSEKRGYFSLVKENAMVFFWNFSSSFPQQGYLRELPKIILVTLIGFLIFFKKTVKEKIFLSTLTSIVLLIFGLALIYPYPLRIWFLTGFQVIYLLFLGLVLAKLAQIKIIRWGVLLFIVLTAIDSGSRLYALYFNPPDDGGNAKIQGKLRAIDYIYQDAAGKPFSLFIFTPPVYTDAFDYLIWWRNQRQYHYLPQKNKTGLFYLLIEPDRAQPWSYQGWLETVIIKGKILETKEVVNGLLVQKRYVEN